MQETVSGTGERIESKGGQHVSCGAERQTEKKDDAKLLYSMKRSKRTLRSKLLATTELGLSRTNA